MSDTLLEIQSELLAAENSRDRAQQTVAGASQTEGCRAELVMLGNSVPESDPRLSFPSWVGNAIHERLAEQYGTGHRLAELRLSYRGVPCTVDLIDPDTYTVRDWKTKGTAADIAVAKRDDPKPEHIAQVMLGAAAARTELALDIRTVELAYIPRSGDLTDGWVWSAPFSQEAADEAAEWHEKLHALVQERSGLDVDGMTEGLRDRAPVWCRRFCTRVTACRGPAPALPVLDESAADVAAEYAEATSLEAEAKTRKARARDFLLGLNGQAGEYRITTSGGREKSVEVEDIEALHQLWAFVHGDEPVPTVTSTTTTPVSLRVTRSAS